MKQAFICGNVGKLKKNLYFIHLTRCEPLTIPETEAIKPMVQKQFHIKIISLNRDNSRKIRKEKLKKPNNYLKRIFTTIFSSTFPLMKLINYDFSSLQSNPFSINQKQNKGKFSA